MQFCDSTDRRAGLTLDSILYVDRCLCYLGEWKWNVYGIVVFTKRGEWLRKRKDATASLHSVHFRSGCFIQGDSSEQGEPDRNNTINQTRLSLKSLFLWVANLLPEGIDWRHGDWQKRMGDPCVSHHQFASHELSETTIWPSFYGDRIGKTQR